jgi:hypothetical protein
MMEAILETWFRPMGLRLRVESDRPELIALAEETFRGFGPPPAAGVPDLSLILLGDGPADGVLGEPRFERGRQTAGSAAELAVEGSVVRGRFSPAAWQSPAFLRLHFLELALYLLLPGRGFLGVHAAACVRHGRAALLRAPGGGGKTTLAYAAARAGFQALAEDVVWIAPGGGLWWGMPWRFRLRPDAVRLFPELAGLREANVGAGLAPAREGVNPSPTSRKIEVDVANAVPSALPGPVVLLRRRPGARSRLERLDAAEALARWDEGRAGNEGESPGYAAQITALLSDGAYGLEVGNVDSALERLSEVLSTASRRNPSSAATGPSQV